MANTNMRAIQLTHDEIETIKSALLYTHDKNLEIVSQNRNILDSASIAAILEQANKYINTQDVFEGDRDI